MAQKKKQEALFDVEKPKKKKATPPVPVKTKKVVKKKTTPTAKPVVKKNKKITPSVPVKTKKVVKKKTTPTVKTHDKTADKKYTVKTGGVVRHKISSDGIETKQDGRKYYNGKLIHMDAAGFYAPYPTMNQILAWSKKYVHKVDSFANIHLKEYNKKHRKHYAYWEEVSAHDKLTESELTDYETYICWDTYVSLHYYDDFTMRFRHRMSEHFLAFDLGIREPVCVKPAGYDEREQKKLDEWNMKEAKKEKRKARAAAKMQAEAKKLRQQRRDEDDDF